MWTTSPKLNLKKLPKCFHQERYRHHDPIAAFGSLEVTTFDKKRPDTCDGGIELPLSIKEDLLELKPNANGDKLEGRQQVDG